MNIIKNNITKNEILSNCKKYITFKTQFDTYMLKYPIPFFQVNSGIANSTIDINGNKLVNFSSYNYLSLSGHPKIIEETTSAILKYGTSTSASRIVSGEIDLHKNLEQKIANLLDCDDAIVMVGGHSTNETVIGHLFNNNDLIICDSFSHNSLSEGIRLSGAKKLFFKHNDTNHLETLLEKNVSNYDRILIVIEGVYSMDGDIADLEAIIKLKKKFNAFIMIDEAHSIGVLGENGKGIGEYYNINRADVDIWMGTLSKSFASCGGYIAASYQMINYLKYTCPGFIFSVGLSPAATAAASASISMMASEPHRLTNLKKNCALMRDYAISVGLDVGLSDNTPIIPIILGSDKLALLTTEYLHLKGYNVFPIIYPAVKKKISGLRFFINSEHTKDEIFGAIDAVVQSTKFLKS